MAATIKRNRSQEAYRRIRGQLLVGRLRAGAKLSDVSLAHEIGVSRKPVREALLRLECEGFVEQVPQVGIFVRVPEVRELKEMYEMRRLLESYAAARAARRINQEQLARLRRLIDESHDVQRETRKWNAYGKQPPELAQRGVLTDVAFHMVILEASGNRRLMQTVADMNLMSHFCGHAWADMKGQSLLYRGVRAFLDHYRIYKALERHDARGARQLMRRHLRPLAEVEAALPRLQRKLAGGKEEPGDPPDWPEAVVDLIRAMEQPKQPKQPKQSPRGS